MTTLLKHPTTFSLLLALATAIPTSAAEVASYSIKILIVTTRDCRDNVTVEPEGAVVELAPGPPATLEPLRRLQIAGTNVDLSGEVPLWNGAAEPSVETGVTLLAAPSITTQAGEEAQLKSGRLLEYFESAGDGCYRLAVTDRPVGVDVSLTFTPGARELDIALELGIDVRVLTSREAVAGVQGLEVGRPVVESRSTKGRLVLRLDRWHLLRSDLLVQPQNFGKEDRCFMMLMRVVRVP